MDRILQAIKRNIQSRQKFINGTHFRFEKVFNFIKRNAIKHFVPKKETTHKQGNFACLNMIKGMRMERRLLGIRF